MRNFVVKLLAAIFMWVACFSIIMWIGGCAHLASTHAAQTTRHGQWRVPPNIVICPNGPVDQQRVERAVAFWEDLGYEFGSVRQITGYYEACVTNDVHKIPFNTIIIDIPDQSFSFGEHAAITRTGRRTNTDVLVMAKIEMLSRDATEHVLEHELGHALGFSDINLDGHLMHFSRTGLGTDTTGLLQTTEVTP